MNYRCSLGLGLLLLAACTPTITRNPDPPPPESLLPAQQTSAIAEGLYSSNPPDQLAAIRAMAMFPDLAKLHRSKIVELQSSPHPTVKNEANKITFVMP